jgi:hypothetical protein
MKLISMTDFVLDQNKKFKSDRFYQGQFKDNVVNYANFLKQPLKLEMFVGDNAIFYFQFEFKEWGESDMENQTIEDLLNDDLSYVLKENAIKRIFG